MSSSPRAPSLIPGVPWALGSREDHTRGPPGRYLERCCVHVGTLLYTRVYTLVYTRVYFSLLDSRDMSTKHTSRVQLLPYSVYTLGDFVLAHQRIHGSALGTEVQNS